MKHGRKNNARTHSSDRCWFGDNPGFTKLSDKSRETNLIENKSDKEYSPIYHDSGFTPTSFFRDKPQNFIQKFGHVSTANQEPVVSSGTGSIKIGKLELDNVVHVPSFSKNLLSDLQLMKAGYRKIIENDTLKIFDKETLVATGRYCNETGLLRMDEVVNNSNKVSKLHDITHWHSMFGHVGIDIIKNTLKFANIETFGDLAHCDACSRAKMRKSSSKQQSSVVTYPLEVVESDTITFALVSYDNYCEQVKFIDVKTGYNHLEFVSNLKAVTLLETFRKFHVMVENVSGFKIKCIRTDDDLSYKGIFFWRIHFPNEKLFRKKPN